MYSGRSSSVSVLWSILAESASRVPEDHIPRCHSVVWVVTSCLGLYHLRSSPSLEEL